MIKSNATLKKRGRNPLDAFDRPNPFQQRVAPLSQDSHTSSQRLSSEKIDEIPRKPPEKHPTTTKQIVQPVGHQQSSIALSPRLQEDLSHLRNMLLSQSDDLNIDGPLTSKLVDACCDSDATAETALQLVGCDQASDAALHVLADSFSQQGCVAHAASCFARFALFPRLLKLHQPASRPLVNALLALRSHQASALLNQVMLPLFWSFSDLDSEKVNARVEVLGRVVKGLPQYKLPLFVHGALLGQGERTCVWTESQATVLQLVLACRPILNDECVLTILQQADANAGALRRSLKFSNLVFTLVRVYGPQLTPHVGAARSLAAQLDTFMRKTALAAVNKITEKI